MIPVFKPLISKDKKSVVSALNKGEISEILKIIKTFENNLQNIWLQIRFNNI